MSDTDKLVLGSGTLKLNGVDVGFLKGDVSLDYKCETVGFKPANELGDVIEYKIRESAVLKASLAEFKLKNLKYAMGSTMTVSESAALPSYNPSSYSGGAGASFDSLTFGGDKSSSTFVLEFRHTKQNGKDIVIVFYSAAALPEFTLPFHEEDFTLYDVAFKALTVATRAAGNKMGVILEQVQGA